MPDHQHASSAAHDPAAVAGACDATEQLAGRLRARGMRVTPQRGQVLNAVRELRHATPEQISGSVPGIDVTTVYRNLELLEELGLVRHTHLGHGAPSYRPAEDDHVHIVCHSCGVVIDADPALVDHLAASLLADHRFTLDRSHFTVFGRCENCAGPDGAELHRSGPQPPEMQPPELDARNKGRTSGDEPVR